MVQRMTPAQFQAWLRQEEQRRRNEINRYNQAVRQHNQKVDQQIRAHNDAVRRHNQEVERQARSRNDAVNAYNREVSRYNQQLKRAIDQHNQKVRSHNARVRSDSEALKRQVNALRSRPTEVRYVTVQTSTYDLYDQLQRIDQTPTSSSERNILVELSERESRNSLNVMDALLSDTATENSILSDQEDTSIVECLQALSEDLCNRWKGAVFSLNPANPDAARHFCTSVREVFTEILERTAPDSDVITSDPNCQRTQQGKPTRKAKIVYLLRQKGINDEAMGNFIDVDIKNIVDLFYVFNEATHGAAGKHAFGKLQAIKRRVEDGIMFLANIAT